MDSSSGATGSAGASGSDSGATDRAAARRRARSFAVAAQQAAAAGALHSTSLLLPSKDGTVVAAEVRRSLLSSPTGAADEGAAEEGVEPEMADGPPPQGGEHGPRSARPNISMAPWFGWSRVVALLLVVLAAADALRLLHLTEGIVRDSATAPPGASKDIPPSVRWMLDAWAGVEPTPASRMRSATDWLSAWGLLPGHDDVCVPGAQYRRVECAELMARREARAAQKKLMYLPGPPAEDDRPVDVLELSREDFAFGALCLTWFVTSTVTLALFLLAPIRNDMSTIRQLALGFCAQRDKTIASIAPFAVAGCTDEKGSACGTPTQQARARTSTLIRRHLGMLALGASSHFIEMMAYDRGWLDMRSRVSAYTYHAAWSLEPLLSRDDGPVARALIEAVVFVLHACRVGAWLMAAPKFAGACRALSAQLRALALALRSGAVGLPQAHVWLHSVAGMCTQVSELASPYLLVFITGAMALTVVGLYVMTFIGQAPVEMAVVSIWGLTNALALHTILSAACEVADAADELAECLDDPAVLYSEYTRDAHGNHGSGTQDIGTKASRSPSLFSQGTPNSHIDSPRFAGHAAYATSNGRYRALESWQQLAALRAYAVRAPCRITLGFVQIDRVFASHVLAYTVLYFAVLATW